MKALFIIAPEGYQEFEYGVPKGILEAAGIEVITASKKKGLCRGSFGGMAKASLSLREVQMSDYDALVFIGGSGAAVYLNDEKALTIARQALALGKVLAAICFGPMILASAGVLKGKKATVWNNDGKLRASFEQYGVKYTGEAVSWDGNIITANGPPAAKEFGRKILEFLTKDH